MTKLTRTESHVSQEFNGSLCQDQSKKLKVLNLYAGIGGNRKLWNGKIEVTAVEIDHKIAEVYKNLYPQDEVIVGDAHEYLRANFRKFDFIWASPPCITHSSLNFYNYNNIEKLQYPDMTLYQEILWLKHWFKGKWVIENVKPYYKALIPPTFNIGRHYFWSSDFILTAAMPRNYESMRSKPKLMAQAYGFDIEKLKGVEVRKVLRNCVVPEMGKYIFEKITETNNPRGRVEV